MEPREIADGEPTKPDGGPRLTPRPVSDPRPSPNPTGAPRASVDLAAELDTRPRKKIDTSELRKISQPLPTVPVERVDIDEDSLTPVRDSDQITRPRDKLPEKD